MKKIRLFVIEFTNGEREVIDIKSAIQLDTTSTSMLGITDIGEHNRLVWTTDLVNEFYTVDKIVRCDGFWEVQFNDGSEPKRITVYRENSIKFKKQKMIMFEKNRNGEYSFMIDSDYTKFGNIIDIKSISIDRTDS